MAGIPRPTTINSWRCNHTRVAIHHGRYCMDTRRRTRTTGLMLFLWAMAGRASAWAAVAGSGLPWDTPLLTVSNALWGTPAHAIMTAVIVFAGLVWAFTDHQIGARRVFAGAMGGSLAINAPQVMAALGWGGALF